MIQILLAAGIALAVFPFYFLGAREQGVTGLAMASVTAISLNAVLTIVWLHVRASAPDPLALVRTFVRGLFVVSIAGVITAISIGLLRASLPWALAELIVGGAIYAVVALVAVRFVGDEAMRGGVEELLARVRRGAVRSDS